MEQKSHEVWQVNATSIRSQRRGAFLGKEGQVFVVPGTLKRPRYGPLQHYTVLLLSGGFW